jgi:ribosomal protein S27AE
LAKQNLEKESTMQSIACDSNSVNILTAMGYVVRGKRATCPLCEGSRKLTVAIHGDLYYCHRCGRGGSVRSLARVQGVSLPPPRIGKAAIQKEKFRKWLADKMSAMSREEHALVRRWRYAVAALKFYPEMPEAWTALADYYHRQHFFEEFWELASDRIGRRGLYKAWRRQHVGD